MYVVVDLVYMATDSESGFNFLNDVCNCLIAHAAAQSFQNSGLKCLKSGIMVVEYGFDCRLLISLHMESVLDMTVSEIALDNRIQQYILRRTMNAILIMKHHGYSEPAIVGAASMHAGDAHNTVMRAVFHRLTDSEHEPMH